MDQHDKPRPVSGEIMTDGPSRGPETRGAAQPVEFTDAEYEPVEAPSDTANAARFAAGQAATGQTATGMDSLRRSAEPAGDRPEGSRRGGPLFWAFGLTLVVLAFWVSGGHALVRNTFAPPVVQIVHPLRIEGVSSRIERHEGREVLFVDGHAENHDTQPHALPSIGIAVTANDGGVTRYTLGTGGTELRPGGRYAFSSRLEAPQGGVKTVSVAFLEDAN